ncbi:hypothetical protein [Rhodococcus erythropolis]|uniref:hypothetical protein n=1 Tax=Rhodococcus erythropolis TaxID=1833 RepID=UPI0030140F3D
MFTGNGFSDKAFATDAMDQVGEPTLKGNSAWRNGAVTPSPGPLPAFAQRVLPAAQRLLAMATLRIWHSWNIGNLA